MVLQFIAAAMSIELKKVSKLFDVWWVFSSFVALMALLRDYLALFAHFNERSTIFEKTSKEKCKCYSPSKKLQSWLLLAEIYMLKDALRCLKQLSLYVRSKDTSVMNAVNNINNVCEKLLDLKQENGQSISKLLKSYNEDGCFKGVKLLKSNSYEKFELF